SQALSYRGARAFSVKASCKNKFGGQWCSRRLGGTDATARLHRRSRWGGGVAASCARRAVARSRPLFHEFGWLPAPGHRTVSWGSETAWTKFWRIRGRGDGGRVCFHDRNPQALRHHHILHERRAADERFTKGGSSRLRAFGPRLRRRPFRYGYV